MRYFVIGEDIPKTEITAQEAAQFVQNDDYKLIVTDDNGDPIKKKSAPTPQPEPDWVPFDFGPVPDGYTFAGYVIRWCDYEGYDGVLDAVPAGAKKLAEPNTWRYLDRRITVSPKYEMVVTPARGECAGCDRITCTRRSIGVRCRNYRSR